MVERKGLRLHTTSLRLGALKRRCGHGILPSKNSTINKNVHHMPLVCIYFSVGVFHVNLRLSQWRRYKRTTPIGWIPTEGGRKEPSSGQCDTLFVCQPYISHEPPTPLLEFRTLYTGQINIMTSNSSERNVPGVSLVPRQK